MKKRIKKRKFLLIRPADVLLPAALLASDLFGPVSLRGWIFTGWVAVRMFALFSADSVRMAYGTQPGMQQVKGSTTLALLMQLAGAAAAAGLYAFVFHGITPFTLTIIGIGLMLNIEQVFYEYINAEGDRYSGVICSILTAMLFITGIFLENGGVPIITLILTGISCFVSLLVAVISCGFRPCGLNCGVFRHTPRAMIYGLAYPLAFIAAMYSIEAVIGNEFMGKIDESTRNWIETGLRCGFFAGYMLLTLFRTPFRRSNAECRTLWPALIGTAMICIAISAACRFISAIPDAAFYSAGAFSIGVLISIAVILALWSNMKKEI